MMVWLLILGFVAAAIGVVVVTNLHERRMDEKVADTSGWVETEATIQSAAGPSLSQRGPSPPGFAFSYSVGGEYFSGKFFLKAYPDQSDQLLKTLLDQKFPVQYDPNHPSAWYIAEATMAGYEIIQ